MTLKTLKELKKDLHWHYDTLHGLKKAAREWRNELMKDPISFRITAYWITRFFNLNGEDMDKGEFISKQRVSEAIEKALCREGILGEINTVELPGLGTFDCIKLDILLEELGLTVEQMVLRVKKQHFYQKI